MPRPPFTRPQLELLARPELVELAAGHQSADFAVRLQWLVEDAGDAQSAPNELGMANEALLATLREFVESTPDPSAKATAEDLARVIQRSQTSS